jgi:hypothetical protein
MAGVFVTLAVGAVYCLICGFGREVLGSNEASPTLACSPEPIFLGEAEQGAFLEKRVLITNMGRVPLIIRRVEPGCGCASAVLSQREILPGTEAYLDLAVRVPKKGRQFQVFLETNDPNNANFILKAFVKVLPSCVDIVPEEVDFGVIVKGSMPEATLELSVKDTVVVDQLKLTVADSKVAARICPARGAEGKAIIQVYPVPTLPEGVFLDSLALFIGKKKILIPVRGKIVEPLVISPRVVYFPRNSVRVQKQIIVRRFDESILGSLTRFEGPEGLSVTEVQSPESKSSRLLLLDLAPKYRTKGFHGRVFLWFSGEKAPIAVEIASDLGA